jgi:competence protein ComEA
LAHDTEAPLSPHSIDPNTAPRDLLMQLPGIGEHKANRIIEGRETGRCQRAEDLGRVTGIGAKTIGKLRDYLTFSTR